MYQLIIFDVDGTFYDLNDVVSDNYNMQVAFYAQQMSLEKKQVIRIFDEEHIMPIKSASAKSATEFFLQNGIAEEEWSRYRDAHTSPQNIKREHAVSSILMQKFSELATLVLLSSNTLENIKTILEWIGIEERLFAGVFCSTSYSGDQVFSKHSVMPEILARFKVEARDALAIGDRLETDIKPLLSLGGDGILIQDPAQLQLIYDDLSGGVLDKTGERKYCFFTATNRRVKE